MAESPLEHIELVKKIIGEDGYQCLLDQYNAHIRLRKDDELQIRRHWKGELERMHLMRMQGVQGPIKLIGYRYG